jgi:hypothetical protein
MVALGDVRKLVVDIRGFVETRLEVWRRVK